MPYHSYDSMRGEFRDLASRNSDVAEYFAYGRSVGGRELFGLRIGRRGRAVLLEGGIHGDEWIGGEMVYLWARTLLENRDKEPYRSIVGGVRTVCIPIANPDGWDARSRTNARGVDLNRNMSEGFCKCNCNTPSPGPGPFSEPETAGLRKVFLEHKPRWCISYHGGAEVLAYPWASRMEPPPDAAKFQEMGNKINDDIERRGYPRYKFGQTIYRSEMEAEMHLPDVIGPMVIYCAGGTTQDWYYANGALSFVLEVSYSKIPPESMIGYYFERQLSLPLLCSLDSLGGGAAPSWLPLIAGLGLVTAVVGGAWAGGGGRRAKV